MDITLDARIVQGPVFDDSTSLAIASAVLGLGAKRFDLELGVNANGDTVVTLANQVIINPDNSFSFPGTIFTLTGLGSSYHQYQLFYNPLNQTADLLVDGIQGVYGYGGTTSNAGNFGPLFGSVNHPQVNFNLDEFDVGNPNQVGLPEPASLTLMGLGFAGLLGYGWRRRQRSA